jgi:hypothetical protein
LFESEADCAGVHAVSPRDGYPGVAGEVGGFGFVEVGVGQDWSSRMFDACAFEAVVDRGSVHVEVACDAADGGTSEVGVDELLGGGGGEGSISRGARRISAVWWTESAISGRNGESMVRKLSTKDHHGNLLVRGDLFGVSSKRSSGMAV